MIKSRFTLKQLEAFVAVIDRGSFRKASAFLGTTQPNVSARIAALEQTLNCVLIYRESGPLRLTDKGQNLLPAAREILRRGEAFLELAERQDLVEERLRLGVTEIVACTWLQSFLRSLKSKYPSVQIELQVNLSTQIDMELASGALDLAIQTGPFKSEVSGTRTLGNVPYVWVASPDIATGLGDAPSMAKLFEKSVLMHAKHTTAATELSEMAQEKGLPNGRIVHSNSLAACLPMAIDGMGVAILPEALVKADVTNGRLIQIAADWTPSPLDLFVRYHADRAPRFVQAAAQLAEQVAEDFE